MNLKFKGSGTSNGVNGTYPHNCYPYKVKRNKDLWDAVLPFPRFPELASIFLIASAATLCYYNSIDGDFVFDDSEAVVNNDDLKPETPIWNLLQNDFWGTRLVHNASHKSYRPLTVLSFRWNYLLSGGLKPWGFHMTNILLHALVSVLSVPVFNFLFGGNSPQAAVLSALLFAVHPIHSEAVAGIVGRADLLCALFFFLSFLVYCHAVQQQELRGILLVILSMLLCTVSMFCKEQGITVIGLCSAYDIIVGSKLHPVRVFETIKKVIMDAFFRRLFLVQSDSDEDDNEDEGDMKTELPPVVIRHLFLAATGISLLLLRWRIMGSSPPIFQKVDNPASFADSLITRVLSYNYIYAINAWLLVCPIWLCFDWSMGCVPLLKSLDDHRGVYVLVFWLMLLVLLYKSFTGKNKRSRRCLTMALALLIVPFLPATNLFFRVGFVIAERVLYLPSAGFCMLVVLGMRELATLPRGKVLLQVGYFYLVLILSLRAILRSSEWRTEKALFKTGLNVCPLNAKVHYNIAKNGGDSGNRTLAVVEYREALRLNPDYDQAMNNLANILKDEGKLKEAEALLRRAVTLRPDFAAAWMNLGIVLSGQKQHQEAEKSYFTALQHRKKYPDCLYNLGNLYLDQKQYQDAYRAWRNATTLKPTHTVAWSNMIIMLDSIGEVAQAESVAHEALALLPHEPSLHFNLANSLGKRGRFAEAEKHFLEALRLDRKNAMYHANLGVLYHRWKKFEKAEKLYKRSLEINPHLQSAKDNLRLLYKTLGKG